MTVLAVIPARLGATRLPRKPLRLLGGIPLIVRVAQRLAALEIADRCVVATDSEEILAVCRDGGVEAVLTRSDHPSGTDRVAEVALRPEFGSYDVVMNLQGDEPFVSHDAVAGALRMVVQGGFTLGTAASHATPDALQRPDIVKVVCDDHGRAMYFSRAPIPHLREPSDATLRNPMIRQHIGVYAYSRDALARWVRLPPHALELVERLEQLRPLAHGIPIGVATVASDIGFGIDTEADLARAEALLARPLSPSGAAGTFRSSDAPATSASFLSSTSS